jgi:glutathione synthase/RimK-type ligase-like ATP-grasp enzyme
VNSTRIAPRVLLLSSRHDYTTDYLASLLDKEGLQFFRLNSDDLPNLKVCLYPAGRKLMVVGDGVEVEVTSEVLQGVLFRAPTFLRGRADAGTSAGLARQHWITFFRSLTVFADATWVNDPNSTFRAENKPYQLYVAARCGFDVPKTVITNSGELALNVFRSDRDVAAKGVDTILFEENAEEAFGYTERLQVHELPKERWDAAPAIIQEWLSGKTDLRVTVVGDDVFTVEILGKGGAITGDWRRAKRDEIEYSPVELPQVVEDCCRRLVDSMGLIFGAIDLVRVENRYYFLEVNPTGEWAWLVNTAQLPIDEALVKVLIGDA